jgi:hypothetical protein
LLFEAGDVTNQGEHAEELTACAGTNKGTSRANLTVNGVAVGQTTGSHARISLNAISNALHRTPEDVDEGVHGNKIKSYPGTGLGVSVDTNGRAYLVKADLTPTEPNHFHRSLNVLGMPVNAETLITSIKPKLLSNGFEFADDIWGLTERGWSIEFHFDRDSSIISQVWIETAD